MNIGKPRRIITVEPSPDQVEPSPSEPATTEPATTEPVPAASVPGTVNAVADG